MQTIAGVANTTANRSFSSNIPVRGVWCERCQTHRKPCMTYLWVNQATPSMNRKAPAKMIRSRAKVAISLQVRIRRAATWATAKPTAPIEVSTNHGV